MASTPASAPRYAPPDPTLPSPWRALIDGVTNYVYYWNPQSGITQYERPGETAGTTIPSNAFNSSNVQGENRPQNSNSSANLVTQMGYPASTQTAPATPMATSTMATMNAGGFQPLSLPSGSVDHKQDPGRYEYKQVEDYKQDDSFESQKRRPAAAVDLFASRDEVDDYRQKHGVIVNGDTTLPFLSFESTGFPPAIMSEV
eukprot:TRINITY_DN300_c0_g1_i3.p1 TRINITY_DN300_c0_g1~~TRINITY_DN300_c0_g1_i3.p1  ORF type:complete len:214 (+),score=23.14 TRINITY_DN300_c0_g1_i3:42-644(+)